MFWKQMYEKPSAMRLLLLYCENIYLLLSWAVVVSATVGAPLYYMDIDVDAVGYKAQKSLNLVANLTDSNLNTHTHSQIASTENPNTS